jgi:hypothetical protein
LYVLLQNSGKNYLNAPFCDTSYEGQCWYIGIAHWIGFCLM